MKNKKKTSTWEEEDFFFGSNSHACVGRRRDFVFFFAQIHEHVWEEEDYDSYITTCGEFSHCGHRKNKNQNILLQILSV